MKNYGLLKFKHTSVESFTTDFGLRIRKIINKPLRRIFRLITKGKIILINYPKLNRNEPYIFASCHGFIEDIIANLSIIDRNAYILFGTTSQLEVNKEMYAAWLNGFIYVNRLDSQSRKDSIPKMERVLHNGNSLLIFPEGGFNNTENLLCQKFFASPYILSVKTGVKVVPIAPFYEFGSDRIYINVGEPVDLSTYKNKHEAMLYLRDIISSLFYETMEKYCTPISRKGLGIDPRFDFMEQRRQEYLKTKWTDDVWEEELTQYLDAQDKEYVSVQESMDNINITKENAVIMAPILSRRNEDQKYDFKKYMHNNWNK